MRTWELGSKILYLSPFVKTHRASTKQNIQSSNRLVLNREHSRTNLEIAARHEIINTALTHLRLLSWPQKISIFFTSPPPHTHTHDQLVLSCMPVGSLWYLRQPGTAQLGTALLGTARPGMPVRFGTLVRPGALLGSWWRSRPSFGWCSGDSGRAGSTRSTSSTGRWHPLS
eukprot:scpid84435/ scgid3828/ 